MQVAATSYTARLHLDMLRNRRITDSIEERRREIAAVTTDFPHVRQAHVFKLRGAWFPIISNLVLSIAGGVAVSYLTSMPTVGGVAWFVTLILGFAFLAIAVHKGAA